MASRYEFEVTISSAKYLKNVNWRHGSLKPYAVVWVDSNYKCSTQVDDEGDTSPFWDQTLVIPLPSGRIEDHTLHIDIVHAGSEEGTKPLIGSAKLKLIDVLDDVEIGERATRALQLKRPSGRPQGKLDVKVTIRDPRYRAPDAYREPPYGQPVVVEEKKKSKFGGMGTGLAVGAVGGVLGGLALAEAIDALEDHVADDVAEKVEDDLAFDMMLSDL
uniref:C2 domain-containing protein n=1 Tax=Populus trichocarpa TaxID=3694 RepID=B9I466_POPTR